MKRSFETTIQGDRIIRAVLDGKEIELSEELEQFMVAELKIRPKYETVISITVGTGEVHSKINSMKKRKMYKEILNTIGSRKFIKAIDDAKAKNIPLNAPPMIKLSSTNFIKIL